MGGEPIRVLHVDDEPGFADMAAEFLEREDRQLEVETATSAEEGLEQLAAADFDCVVADYDMPRTDGIEFLEQVRAEHPDLPFLLFTGKGSEEVASDAIRAGVTDYLQKGSGTSQYELLANRIRNAVEQFRAERRARLQERQYRDLFEQAPIMYVLVRDERGWPVIEDCNDRFLETLGYDREEVIGRPTTDFFTDASAVEVYDGGGYERALTGEFDLEERTLVTKGGERIHTRLRASPRLDEQGDVIGVQTLYLDVTDQKRRERELERYETIIEASGDAVYTLDDEGHFTFVNDAFCELVGYAEGELLGAHASIVMDEADIERSEAVIRDLLTSDEDRATIEMELVRADGDRVGCETHIALLPSENGEFRGTTGIHRDITERKRRQQELEEKTAWLEALFENSPDMINLHDVGGNIINPNPRLCEETGYDAGRLTDMKVWELDRSLDPDEARSLWTEMDVDDRHRLDSVYERRDGSTFPVEVHIRRIEIEDHPRFVVIGRDITERKERERRLEEYREYTDRLLDAIDDVLFVHDENGDLQRWNEALTDTTGYSDEELASMNGVELVPQEDRERAADGIREVFETGHARLEAPLLAKDGTAIPYEYVADRVEHPDGEPRLVGIGRDISERKQREWELERYERIIQAINDGVVVVEDGMITYTNPRVSELIGYTAEELSEKPMGQFIAPEYRETVQRRFEQRISGEDPPDTYEIEILSKGGNRIPVEITVAKVSHDDPSATVSIVRDVTDRKRRERELERQNERLEEFASVVSHDLRNPLNVAEGRLDLAREECDSEHLDAVAQALDRMDALIEDLLTLAREGESVEDPEAVDLAALVDACWANVETADATLVADTERTIRADRSRLQQLLENLVRNAVDHGGSDVTVTVGDLDDGTGFYVADDGPGIPADARTEVFEYGYSTIEDGTGFGLAIVKEIAETHGWDVTLTESKSGGARFEITGVESA